MAYSYRSNTNTSHNPRRSFGASKPHGSKRRQGQYIDPARFVKAARPVEEEQYVARHSFADFKFGDLLKQNLALKGFLEPTPIQDQTIAPALEGKDIIGIANTGTGKTAAFGIPVLEGLINTADSRALIVAPTRELAQQIDGELRTIGKGSGLHGAVLIGGAPIGPQLRDLRFNPRIVIGTPGRIKDHIERGSLDLSHFSYVVLDEVDRMLDMGFVNDVRTILSHLATERQSFFFSATLDERVSGLIRTFSSDPLTIALKSGQATDTVHQDVIRYGGTTDKLDKLHDLLINGDVSKAIVFDDTQRSVERLSRELIARGFSADAIHGGKTQGQRQRALSRFKQNDINILVATDVAARGIDVVDISHVINYSQPQSYEDYVHRIGRTGRAGRTGYALTFVTS
jgi:ATP-dependent RNA helicase RhlE